MKMPPVFAKQANIASGHQQVNNVTHARRATSATKLLQ
jgi:hypothetical protein